MIGNESINRDSLDIYTGSRAGSRALGDTFYSLNSTYAIGLHIGRSTQMPAFSDQYPYYEQGYNANCIIEGDFSPYYHTTQDRITANTFDTIFFSKVVKGMVATLATFAQPDTLYKDVAVLEITQPTGTIDSGSIIIPQAKVKNVGFNPETFSLSFRIGDFYNETRNKALAPGQIDTVNFPNWVANRIGTYATKCTTQLAGDMNSSNDYAVNSVTVQPLGVEENSNSLIPQTFILENTSPNPFQTNTIIRYGLPKETSVNLQIYDVTGTLVITLKNGKEKPGFYQVSWDGKNNQGKKVAKGIYFYRLEAETNKAIKKMIKLN
jgi:FlgD Ig-like domain